jgi:hypothetical protein
LGAMVFIGILVFLIDPTEFSTINFFEASVPAPHGDWVAFTLWLPWNILIDYVSLFKTRIMLRVLTRMGRRTNIIAIPILGIDFLVYMALSLVGIVLTTLVFVKIQTDATVTTIWNAIPFGTLPSSLLVSVYKVEMYTIFFWAGFAPSLWLWLYVLALFVTRGLLRSERIVNWLRWGLDVEKNPIRSLGAVAAILSFVASVAIILVSAEVSRISGAA